MLPLEWVSTQFQEEGNSVLVQWGEKSGHRKETDQPLSGHSRGEAPKEEGAQCPVYNSFPPLLPTGAPAASVLILSLHLKHVLWPMGFDVQRRCGSLIWFPDLVDSTKGKDLAEQEGSTVV